MRVQTRSGGEWCTDRHGAAAAWGSGWWQRGGGELRCQTWSWAEEGAQGQIWSRVGVARIQRQSGGSMGQWVAHHQNRPQQKEQFGEGEPAT